MKSRVDTISTALALIFFGVVFLLLNTSIVSGRDLFGLLFVYWPLLIVFVGVKIIVGVLERGKLINLILDAVFYIIIIVVLLLPKYFPTFGYSLEPLTKMGVSERVEYVDSVDSVEYAGKEIEKKVVKVDVGALEFNLSDSDVDEYATVVGEYRKNFMKPSLTSSLDSGVLYVLFNQKRIKTVHLGLFNDVPSSFDIVLGYGEIETDLNVSLGAGKGSISLDKTNLVEGLFDVGAGQLDISLFNTAPESIELNVGAGEIILKMDRDSAVNITYSVGMGGVKIYEGTELSKKFDGIVTNGGYSRVINPNSKTTLVDINVGAGDVKVIFE